MTRGIFWNYGDANMTMYNLTYDVTMSINLQGFIISYRGVDRCTLLDDTIQIVDIDTVYSTMESNPGGDLFSCLGNWLNSYTTRYFMINTRNVVYTKRMKDSTFVFGTYGRFYESVYYENFTLSESQVVGRPMF